MNGELSQRIAIVMWGNDVLAEYERLSRELYAAVLAGVDATVNSSN